MQALSVPVHSLAPLISPTYWSIKMKRLNPATGLPFKHGNIREDGYVFYQYYNRKSKNGYFYEGWFLPDVLKKLAEQSKINSAKARANTKGRSSRLIYAAKRRAEKNNISFSLTIEDVFPVIEKGFCELTNLPFDLNPQKKHKQNPHAPSLDRINSSKGYTKQNTRVVLSAVNTALNEYGEKIMLPILEAMVKGIKKNVKKKSTTPISTGSN